MFEAGLKVDEHQPGIITVCLDRPAALNALTTATAREFVALYSWLAVRQDMRALILTGAGDRAFCAGADLKERAQMSQAALREQHATHRLAYTIRRSFEFPVIAAVNGLAYGGGAELAFASDIVFAVPDARFALPEITRGIMPGMGGAHALKAAMGHRRAAWHLLTGEELSAEDALGFGLVTRIVPAERLMSAAMEFANTLSSLPAMPVRSIIRNLRGFDRGGIDAQLDLELALHQRLMDSADRAEGAQAFAEGRPPVWPQD